MNLSDEIPRLRDLLPAAWRMQTTIKIKNEQMEVIASRLQFGIAGAVQIHLNSRLWQELSEPQRDLVFLREIAWRQTTNWVQFGAFQGLSLLGVAGLAIESIDGDAMGIAVATLLAGVGAQQILRQHRSAENEVNADTEAIDIAQRRSYSEKDAAEALLEAIPAIAKLENRYKPSFTELIRCQNLRILTGQATVKMPSKFQ
ncbi:MAG: DUF3318 domain-containing protein [Pseudanabaena sp. ELA607]|jgi:hypothetical protein